MRCAGNWRKNWGSWRRSASEVARIVHEYPGGGSVELRFFEVRNYQGEIENRIFREIRWVTRQELLGLDFLEADLGLVKDLAAGKNYLS